MSKTIKFQVDEGLWEKFYRAFPGQGERSTLLRKVVRYIVLNKAQHTFFHERVGADIVIDLEANSD